MSLKINTRKRRKNQMINFSNWSFLMRISLGKVPKSIRETSSSKCTWKASRNKTTKRKEKTKKSNTRIISKSWRSFSRKNLSSFMRSATLIKKPTISRTSCSPKQARGATKCLCPMRFLAKTNFAFSTVVAKCGIKMQISAKISRIRSEGSWSLRIKFRDLRYTRI